MLVSDSNLAAVPDFVARAAPAATASLQAIYGAAQGAFVAGIVDTFRAGAFICLFALAAAFMVRNPRRSPATSQEPRSRATEATSTAD